MYNMLNRKIQVSINKIKRSIMQTKFQQKHFNQSETKHRQLIKKLECLQETKSDSYRVVLNGLQINDDIKIADAFAENLAKTFSLPTKILPLKFPNPERRKD